MLGAFRARAVPFNVNHHYQPHGIRSLLRSMGTEAVVYQRRLAGVVGAAIEDADLDHLVLVEIDDGSAAPSLPGAVDYEQPIAEGDGSALPAPQGDDRYLVCTGGITGPPKGVLWRQAAIRTEERRVGKEGART